MNSKILIILTIIIIIVGCTKDRMPTAIELDNQLRQNIIGASPDQSLDYYILPKNDLSLIPQDPKNPLTEAKVNLGKMLFFDTGKNLSKRAVLSSIYKGVNVALCCGVYVCDVVWRCVI